MSSPSIHRAQAVTLVLRMLLVLAVLVLLAFGVREVAGPVFTEGAVFTRDAVVATWLHERSFPAMLQVMRAVSAVHGPVAILVWSVLHAGWWLRRGDRAFGLRVLLVAGGALLTNAVLKLVFARARPTFDGLPAALDTFSFPSGHTVGTTVFYGLLVIGVFRFTQQTTWRAASVLLAVVMVLWVASSRLYLGAHFVSDVIGAMVVGGLWLIGCTWPWPNRHEARASSLA